MGETKANAWGDAERENSETLHLSSLQQRCFKAHSALQLEKQWIILGRWDFIFLKMILLTLWMYASNEKFGVTFFTLETPQKLFCSTSAGNIYLGKIEPGWAIGMWCAVTRAHHGLCFPDKELTNMPCAPSNLHPSLPIGTKIWKRDDKFASTYVSSQNSVLKNTSSSRIWSFLSSLWVDKTFSSFWMEHISTVTLCVFSRWISSYLPDTLRVAVWKLLV